MPVYIACPHCEFPAVLPSPRPGERYRCRQCNSSFVIRGVGEPQAKKPPQHSAQDRKVLEVGK